MMLRIKHSLQLPATDKGGHRVRKFKRFFRRKETSLCDETQKLDSRSWENERADYFLFLEPFLLASLLYYW
jgi:hypothetical protein